MSRNEITGDNLASKATSDAYRDGWDRIFGKGNDMSAENSMSIDVFNNGPAENAIANLEEFVGE